MKPSVSKNPSTPFRAAAEARLNLRNQARPPESETDVRRLQHELEVHQIELEMQNEELRRHQAELEASIDRYTDLYDFAPVGYFNLAADGRIQLVNLTACTLTTAIGSVRSGTHFCAEKYRASGSTVLLSRAGPNGCKSTRKLMLVRTGNWRG